MDEKLENLKLVLTSPRERAPGTITSYLQTARIFLEFLGDGQMPTGKDESKKLAEANNWPWPFTSDDKPVAEEEPFAPAFTPEEIETLIKARDEYSKGELFYLAVSTTWGLRREEMARIRNLAGARAGCLLLMPILRLIILSRVRQRKRGER